jgi:indole-3-glycerol phosphate synthase
LGTILDKIIEHKHEELKSIKVSHPLQEIKEDLKNSGFVRSSFYDALSKTDGVNIIAEVKKGSPSKGVICHDFDHIKIAKEYEKAGASAVSVLTDEHFFYGRLSFLKDIRKEIKLPILRKDFIIDEYQIFEAKSAGADAVLLIAAVLDKDTLTRFLALTHELSMDALVEVHNEEELKKVLATDAVIIGINNRNLKDFSVDLNTTRELARVIKSSDLQEGAEEVLLEGAREDLLEGTAEVLLEGARALVVSESGIHKRADIDFLLSFGVNSFLIGEALVKGGSIQEKMRELIGR